MDVFEKIITVTGTVSDELAGVSSVTVNGVPTAVNNGQFYTNNIPITPGRNAITATATDNAGNSGNDTNNITLLSGVQTLNYTYDNNGNLASKNNLTAGVTTNYTYNYENMLINVTRNASPIVTYEYNGRNNRTAKTLQGETTQYIYDGPNTLEELDGAGSLKKTYTYGIGIDELLSTINHQLSATNYYHTDILGSVTSMTNTDGNTVQEYSYDAFGEIRRQSGNIDNDYLFTAREWNSPTGLYYYRARYYDPRVGRFVTEDPIGFQAGVNFYTYVLNNPTNYDDPLGLASTCPKKCRQLTPWKELPMIGDPNTPPPGSELKSVSVKDYYRTVKVYMTQVRVPGVSGGAALACTCQQRWLYRKIESVYLVKVIYEAMFLCWHEGCYDFWEEGQQQERRKERKYTKEEPLMGEFWESGIAVGNWCDCYTALGVKSRR